MQLGKPGAVLGGKYARFHCLGMCLRYQKVTNRAITETRQNELTDQFIRISVETAAHAPRFWRPQANPISVSLRSPERLEKMLMRFHKTHRKKWNGAGTFGFLVTLKEA